MSYPHKEPDRFDGLLEHVERYLGPARYTQPAEIEGRDRGFAVGIHDHPELSMVTAATTGARFQAIQSPLPLEFACSARPGQEDEAAYLVHVFADMAVENGSEVEYDDGFLNEEPLVPGTSIHGLLAAPHPRADEMFNLFRNARGELQLQFITLVPITGPEAEYLRDHETGELFELWESRGTDLLDVYRASAV
ncbi:MAG: Suppressor of fused protein [Actinoallomurus sp.]|nr:Suppressor of fused protein [Actinoallomurus sp.]